MPKVVGYHRPASVREAVELLGQPSAAVLAGGTRVNATPFGSPIVAVDIQALGLRSIEPAGPSRVRLGAMVTLQQMVDSSLLPEVLRECARREEPSTLRTLATIGGTAAAGGWESEVVTALLVADAQVTIESRTGSRTVTLPELLADCDLLVGGLITSVDVATDGAWSVDRTGRTPGDRAIVCAVARRGNDGVVRLAASGVSPTPILLSVDTPLTPPADFRGSSEYRGHVARTLLSRVSKAVLA